VKVLSKAAPEKEKMGSAGITRNNLRSRGGKKDSTRLSYPEPEKGPKEASGDSFFFCKRGGKGGVLGSSSNVEGKKLFSPGKPLLHLGNKR